MCKTLHALMPMMGMPLMAKQAGVFGMQPQPLSTNESDLFNKLMKLGGLQGRMPVGSPSGAPQNSYTSGGLPPNIGQGFAGNVRPN